ncbi:MAG: ABC transporter permease [Gammaproteobacteria bacterium]|jgi:putative ABC transport system permease protein|nr:ABC transporter permease [Gammaproteobacteria bacterium]
MNTPDFIRLTLTAITAHRLRTALTVLGISIGIAAVVLLTSIGEGIHRFVLSEFTQFGTTIIGINPGKATTAGGSIGVFGTERPLTIDDALALQRIPNVQAVVPVVQGNAEVEAKGRGRRTTVYGVTSGFPEAFRFDTAIGKFLPADDPQAPRALAVLGDKLRTELFGNENPMGQRIRIGGDRYRVVGAMQPKGQILGFDLDDTVYIPTRRAMQMFNRESLMEIDVMYREGTAEKIIVKDIKRILQARHGKEDFTITTQQQMLDVLSSVLNILTFAVGALGGISLLVGAVGIATIMTMAVRERTAEIGLLRALGAHQKQVLTLFLGEAVVLAAIGGFVGLAIGVLGAQLLHMALPAMPVHTPWIYVVFAEALAISIGLLAGVLPARHAAAMDPVTALRAE